MKYTFTLIHSEGFIKICLCLLLMAALLTGENGLSAGVDSDTYEVIVVKEGDSVWNIASQFVADRDDIRHVVFTIKEINRLNDCFLQEKSPQFCITFSPGTSGEFLT